MLEELVWDGWCSVAVEKQGHRGHATQHIVDLALVEDGRWCGLVILLHIRLFHRTRTRQVQVFKGAVEYQSDSDVVLAVGVMGIWLPPVRGSQVARVKKSWVLATQHSSRGTSEGSSKTKVYWGTVSSVLQEQEYYKLGIGTSMG